jgi:putative Ca2+/H+ antiporter (TMEM165/GDT1 family)
LGEKGENFTNWRLILTAFGVIFLSEMGDKTQVTTMLLAGAKPQYVLFVALGSAMALITASFIEVIIGSKVIGKYLNSKVVKISSGIAFIIMGFLLMTGLIGSSV